MVIHMRKVECKMSDTPKLILDPVIEDEQVDALIEPEKKDELDIHKLSEDERKQVYDFAKQIDLTNSNIIIKYGAAAQVKIASFSEKTLERVRTKDLGEVGNALQGLVTELKGLEITSEDKGFLGLFKKQANKIVGLKARFDKAEINVDKICSVLEKHQVQLMKDIAGMDEMYQMNEDYYKELTMYILAGKVKLQQAKNEELPKLKLLAQQSDEPLDSQKVNDYASLIARFEKKLHDLELTRMISIQMGPQIRMIQNNDILMSEKIDSSLTNTIPLWKSQFVLALGQEHTRKAMEAQRSVTDMTNELLNKNAEALKTNTIETAKEAERGIVELETLQHTNTSLIETLDEVSRIQEEGRQKRETAESELVKMEAELKKKLLDLKG